jgi:hypothetical protein
VPQAKKGWEPLSYREKGKEWEKKNIQNILRQTSDTKTPRCDPPPLIQPFPGFVLIQKVFGDVFRSAKNDKTKKSQLHDLCQTQKKYLEQTISEKNIQDVNMCWEGLGKRFLN